MGKKIIEIESIKSNIEDIKNNYKKKFLLEIDKYLDDSEHTCPVCGSTKDRSIKEIINDNLKKIKDIDDEIIKSYQDQNQNLQPQEIFNNVQRVKSVISDNKIDIKVLENYYICGGNKEKSDLILVAKIN